MNGILLVDKPAGWTSHDVVARLRGLLKEKRIGHTGTLDPMATGLLVVFVGRATRAVQFAEADEKQYLATIRLGLTTDTQDTTGQALRACDAAAARDALPGILPRFTGELWQTPPMYSAIKIGGQKLVDVARRGGELPREPRRITIHELRISGEFEGDPLLFVHCSKGTYVRTLFHDMGEALGCGACLSSLRRVAAGPFSIVDAYRMGEINCEAVMGNAASLMLPLDTLFEMYPALTANAAEERAIRCGQGFDTAGAPVGHLRLYGESGEFLALAASDGNYVQAVKSFFEVTA